MRQRLPLALACLTFLIAAAATGWAGEKRFSTYATAPDGAPVSSARLVAMPADGDGDLWVAVHIELAEGWHTYWRNPGDAGAPSAVAWILPSGASAGPLLWPAPQVIREGEIVTFGYKDEAWLLSRISGLPVADDALVGAEAHWLVCAEICIPQSASLRLPLGDLAGEAGADAAGMAEAIAALPAPSPAPLEAAVVGDTIRLTVRGLGRSASRADDIGFVPDTFGVIDYAAEQVVAITDEVLSLTLRRDLSTGAPPARLAGVLVLRGPEGIRAYEISEPLIVSGEG